MSGLIDMQRFPEFADVTTYLAELEFRIFQLRTYTEDNIIVTFSLPDAGFQSGGGSKNLFLCNKTY